ncbi:GtrA family protein [Mesorhizobium sp. WSM2239]|uniref:GtrA family protein n=2 Tax=unclassified Mesorhizobium TaxID=325217 RepID=A0AAU8D9B6_9HYPH
MTAEIRPAATGLKTEIGLSVIATVAVLVLHAIRGFETLTDFGGDNDSLMRLVQVRDLIGGQGWFDLNQYRMGPEGGFVMHWSRLVDAPIAAIILAASPLAGGMAAAETVAQILWPALLFCLTLFFLVRIARLFGGEPAVLPSVVIGAAALHFIGVFAPGALDHHNIQLMLTAASLCLLVEAPGARLAATVSGACAALMLAVGMEAAPYVAVIGLCMAGLFLFGDKGDATIARDFGFGFAGIAALAFFVTVPPSGWAVAQCDAFSVVQFAVAALAGIGLAGIASIGAASRTRNRRLIGLGLLGLAVGAAVLLLFPQCLADPYSMVDERLRKDWLDHVSEAKPLLALISSEPGSVVARYVTPLMGLIWIAGSLRGGSWRRQDVLVGAVLAMAFAVSVWQVRGSNFSIAFAIIPLSAWIGSWRLRAEAGRSGWVSAKMVAVWVLSLNASWTAAAAATVVALESDSTADPEARSASECERKKDFTTLAAMPAATVLSISNLGSAILAFSDHHAVSGPYHRNLEGNRLALDVSMGLPEDARALMERHGVELLAVCPANPESALLAKKAPGGLLAAIMNGAVPVWLEPVEASENEPLKLYRMHPRS